jgi:hypothetical protein
VLGFCRKYLAQAGDYAYHHSNHLCAFCAYVANTKASNLAHNRPDTVFGIGIAWLPTTVESPAKFVSGL